MLRAAPIFPGFDRFRYGTTHRPAVPDCSKKTLPAIAQGKIDTAAITNTNGRRGYDGLADVGVDRRVRHDQEECVQGASRTTGIESFWSVAKARLHQFKGVTKCILLLHLKESYVSL